MEMEMPNGNGNGRESGSESGGAVVSHRISDNIVSVQQLSP